jgi:hypothetical protein
MQRRAILQALAAIEHKTQALQKLVCCGAENASGQEAQRVHHFCIFVSDKARHLATSLLSHVFLCTDNNAEQVLDLKKQTCVLLRLVESLRLSEQSVFADLCLEVKELLSEIVVQFE